MTSNHIIPLDVDKVMGVAIIVTGYIFLMIRFFAQWYLEKIPYFSMKEAYGALNKINENHKDPRDINRSKKYMRLTWKNIRNELGKGIELKIDEGDLNIYNKEEYVYSELEYTFENYFQKYIEFCDEEQRDTAKKHLKTMLDSMDEKGNIKWKPLANELVCLNEEITTYLRENNLNLTYKKLPGRLEWISKNRDLIYDTIKIIAITTPIIYFIIERKLGELIIYFTQWQK